MENQAIEQDETVEVESVVLDSRAAAVFAWRLEELQRAGYGEYATMLAEDHTIDLHVACDLRKQGCPEETAYRILA